MRRLGEDAKALLAADLRDAESVLYAAGINRTDNVRTFGPVLATVFEEVRRMRRAGFGFEEEER